MWRKAIAKYRATFKEDEGEDDKAKASRKVSPIEACVFLLDQVQFDAM